ncbi:MAG: hypothetical protein ACM31L_04535 [Actinomycetota bacterium]
MEANQTSEGVEESGVVAEHSAREEIPTEQTEMAEYIEDAEGQGAGTVVLDDGDLARGGIVAVKAYVRTKASANALRQQRKRERQAENGARQLAILAPNDNASRDALKAVGAAMRERGLPAETVALMAGAEPDFVRMLFALDPKMVALMANSDADAVEQLMKAAGMLERDPHYVMLSMRLDEALVRTILAQDQSLVAQVLALPEATLRALVEPAAAAVPNDGAEARTAAKPRHRSLRTLLPGWFRGREAAAC